MEVAPTLYQIEAQFRAALDVPAPRHDTHNAFAPRPRTGWQAGVIPSGARAAAALVLFYPVAHQVHVVLTRRAGTLGQHAGQVSLPGGAVDGDEFRRRFDLPPENYRAHFLGLHRDATR